MEVDAKIEENFEIFSIAINIILSILSLYTLITQKTIFIKIYKIQQKGKIVIILLLKKPIPKILQSLISPFSTSLNNMLSFLLSKILSRKEKIEKFNFQLFSNIEAVFGLIFLLVFYFMSESIKKKNLDKKDIYDLDNFNIFPITFTKFKKTIKRKKFKKFFWKIFIFEIFLQTAFFSSEHENLPYNENILEIVDFILFISLAVFCILYTLFTILSLITSSKKVPKNKLLQVDLKNQFMIMEKAKRKSTKKLNPKSRFSLESFEPKRSLSMIIENEQDEVSKKSSFNPYEMEEKSPLEKLNEIDVGRKLPRPSNRFSPGRRPSYIDEFEGPGTMKISFKPRKLKKLGRRTQKSKMLKKSKKKKNFEIKVKNKIKNKSLIEKIDDKSVRIYSLEYNYIENKVDSFYLFLENLENIFFLFIIFFLRKLDELLTLITYILVLILLFAFQYLKIRRKKMTSSFILKSLFGYKFQFLIIDLWLTFPILVYFLGSEDDWSNFEFYFLNGISCLFLTAYFTLLCCYFWDSCCSQCKKDIEGESLGGEKRKKKHDGKGIFNIYFC